MNNNKEPSSFPVLIHNQCDVDTVLRRDNENYHFCDEFEFKHTGLGLFQIIQNQTYIKGVLVKKKLKTKAYYTKFEKNINDIRWHINKQYH